MVNDRSEASSSAKSRRNVALSERSESICGEPRMDGRVNGRVSGRVSDGKRGIWGWAVYICQIFYGGALSPPGWSGEWRRVKIVWPLTSQHHARSCHKLLDREITSFSRNQNNVVCIVGERSSAAYSVLAFFKSPNVTNSPYQAVFLKRARLNINKGQQ